MKRYTLTPRQIQKMPEKQVRAIYSEWRKIANKRSARMAKAGVTSVFAGVYFPTIQQLGDIESIRGALASVSRQLRDPRSSITGAKKYNRKMIESFHLHGYDFGNEGNLKQFAEFMEWSRARAGANDRVFKSDRAAEVFEQAEKQEISIDNLKKHFDAYQKQMADHGRLYPYEQRRRQTSDDYKSRFEHRRGASRADDSGKPGRRQRRK